MSFLALFFSTWLVAQPVGLDEVRRALDLRARGDTLEATLVLRKVAEDGTPEAQDLARYHLGVVAEEREDWNGAALWFERVGGRLADAMVRLDRALRLATCYARTGRAERVPALLEEWARDPAARELVREVRLRLLELAFREGNPEWVRAGTGRTAEAVVDDVIKGGRPEELAFLAVLKGLPVEVQERSLAALAGPQGIRALASLAVTGPRDGGGVKVLLERAPTLSNPADGPVLVPAPMTGANAVFGQSLLRLLTLVNTGRARPVPWRFVDTENPSWIDEASRVLRDDRAVAVLGPMGEKSLAALAPVLERDPVPVLPLFPSLSASPVSFPYLQIVFSDRDLLGALAAEASRPGPDPNASGPRILVAVSASEASRGVGDALTVRLKENQRAPVATWLLPADAKAQTAMVEAGLDRLGWHRETASAAPFDVLVLATGPAEGRRVLGLLAFAGLLPLPADGCKEGARCYRAVANRTVKGAAFADPVTHLTEAVVVVDPCAPEEAATDAVRTALGRAPFAVEMVELTVAQVLAQALDACAGGTALDLYRVFREERSWTGACGPLMIHEGVAAWPLKISATFPPRAPDPGGPPAR